LTAEIKREQSKGEKVGWRERGLNLGDLEKIKLNWSFAPEDRDKDGNLTFVLIDLIDGAKHVCKGTLDDFDGLAQ